MTFIKAAELSSGKKIGVKVKGKEILIVNLDGRYYALGNVCSHMGCKLSEGTVKGDKIECPCHGSTYDIKTGKVVKGPAKKPEPTFKVKIEDNDIMIDI